MESQKEESNRRSPSDNVVNKVTLRVTNNTTYLISGCLDSDIYKLFKRALGWRPDAYKHMIRQYAEKVRQQCIQRRMSKEYIDKAVERAKQWDGYKSNVCYNKATCHCLVKKPYTHFSTGLLSQARKFFDKHKIPYQIIEGRKVKPQRQYNYSMSEEYEPRTYQIETKNKSLDVVRGIIQCATGGGKTPMSCSIIAGAGVGPCVFYVTSKDLLHQAEDELKRFIRRDGHPVEIGVVGGGRKDIRDITVMTVQTAIRSLDAKYAKFDDEDDEDETDIADMKDEIKHLITNAKMMVCDEVQHWAAHTCQVISDASSEAYYRFGLSATPYRDMGDDILIDACFGRVISKITASYLIQNKYLIRPNIYMLHIENMRNCPYSSYDKIYKFAIKENIKRNKIIALLATKYYEQGRLPMILVRHIDHGNLLKEMIPGSVFLTGKMSSKKRKAHLDLMRARKAPPTIATSLFDEGVDVKPLDMIIQAGSGKSPTRALQRIGRILRPWPNVENNLKENVIAIDFIDHCRYMEEHSEKRIKIYRTEPEFQIEEKSYD